MPVDGVNNNGTNSIYINGVPDASKHGYRFLQQYRRIANRQWHTTGISMVFLTKSGWRTRRVPPTGSGLSSITRILPDRFTRSDLSRRVRPLRSVSARLPLRPMERVFSCKWRTGYEVDNLGFHVYREERGHLVRLTPELVAGSALLAGAGTALTAGHSYSWWDDPGIIGQRSAHSSRSSQSCEILARGYRSQRHENLAWAGNAGFLSRSVTAEKIKPELMSELGRRLSQKYDDFWRAQDLKKKLRQSSAIRRTGSARVVKSASTAVARQQNKQDAVQRVQASNQDQSMQWHLATRAAVKILVKDKGWYRVTRAELIAAGLSSSANPRKLHLYRDGREQPIKVVSEKSGRTETLSAVEFYGEGLDTPSADTRAYWLIEGSWAGQRIDEFRSRQRGSLGAPSFPYTVEKKDRVFYFAGLKNGEAESFFGPLVTTDPVDQVLAVSHADPAPPENPLLEVALRESPS